MISDQDAKHIAHLARIHLKDEEAKNLSKNLEDILTYVHKLNDLDVSNIEPTSHVLPLHNVYREDQTKESLGQDKSLSVAVDKQNGSFKVPKVIE